MYYVYILESEQDGSFYIGYSSDVQRRLVKHNTSERGYTSQKQPWKIVYTEEYATKTEAIKRERFLNLSWFSYLCSKAKILFALSAFQTLSFVLVGNTLLGIKGMYLSYWLMLFSVSCFANVLGLTISSAFRSVVTCLLYTSPSPRDA